MKLVLSLLDPRVFVVYDSICNALAAVIVSMQKRGLFVWVRDVMCRKLSGVIQKVLSVEKIPNANCLGLLLLRLPVINPVLFVFRSVLSFYVLNRLQCSCLLNMNCEIVEVVFFSYFYFL